MLGISHSACERSASFTTFCSCGLCYQAVPKCKTGGVKQRCIQAARQAIGARLCCILRSYFREGAKDKIMPKIVCGLQQTSNAVQRASNAPKRALVCSLYQRHVKILMLVMSRSYHICMGKDSLDVSCTLNCFLQLSPVLSVGQPQGIPTCIPKGSVRECSEA